ncbi:MAG TPA: ABC transporter substrate-binding protein [Ilumatobacteraceae bacterium]|nr:ABC transporter substrate-binding protein [Ilumatobacteraceae bacterium]
MEAGPLAQPAIGDSARAAVSYINKYMSGVDGRPIELDQCFVDGSPESSAKCATQFVANGTQVVAMALDFTDAALLPVLAEAGITVIGQQPFSEADYTTETAHYFAGSQIGSAYGLALYLRDEIKPKSVSVLTNGSAGAKSRLETFIVPALEQAGVTDVNTVVIDPSQPDFSVIVAAALSNSPDLIFGFLQESDCTKLVTTARQLNFTGDIVAGNCAEFVTDSGDAAEGVYVVGDMYNPYDDTKATPRAKEELKLFLDAMEEFAPDRSIGVFTQFMFAGIMNLRNLMVGVGADNYSSEAVEAAMAATDGEPSFMAESYGCAPEPVPGYSVCGASTLIFQVRDGKLVQASDWIFGPDLWADN